MKIHIMDPGLRDLTGHHYDFVNKANSYLRSAGHEVVIFCHRDAKPEVLNKFDNIVAHFRSFPYPQFHGEILDYHYHSQLLSEDLSNIPLADHWLWPSAFSFQVNGCRLSGTSVKSVGCVHVEHQFHHVVYGAAQWLDAAHDNFKLFAIEQKLVEDYVNIGVPCQYAPNPADNVPIAAPKQMLHTLGFLGHQRADKGSNAIADIVAQLMDRYKIVLHDSSGSIRIDHPNVTCHGAVPVLSDLIRQCDLIVLPYDRTKYRKMSSGILCESLSVGVPCIVPSETAQADWVQTTGAGAVFTEFNVVGAIDSLDYNTAATSAYHVAQNWHNEYGIAKFISALMGQN